MATIVWINGAFGAGKTQTTLELRRRVPSSVVYDPEYVGIGIQRALPGCDDFQDLQIWRRMTHEAISFIAQRCASALLVPMTLVVPECFDDIHHVHTDDRPIDEVAQAILELTGLEALTR